MKSTVSDHKRIIILLAAASFYFLSVDVLADSALASRIDASRFVAIRILYLLAMSAGFLACSRLPKSRFSLTVLTAVSILSMFGTAFAGGTALVICVLISLFCAGLVGAATYGIVAVNIGGEHNTGMLCAGSMGIAAILQVAASMLPVSLPVYALILSAALLISAALIHDLMKDYPDISSAGVAQTAAGPSPEWKLPDMKLFLIGVAIISVMGGLNDGVLTEMQTSGALNLYALPRLFYFAGMLLAGFIADRFHFRGLSLLTLFVMICATAGALFMSSPATIFINASIYSLFAGIVIIYFTVPLFKTSTVENVPLHPALGRAVRLPAMAAGILLYDKLFAVRPFHFTIATYVLLSAALTAVFIISAQLAAPESRTPEISAEEAFEQLRQKYDLTPKETEVLRELINTSDKQEAVAEKLGMSVNTMRHHVTSIYDKTGVYSRSALLELFYGITKA